MNDIDRYLDQACRSVSGPASLRKHLRAELKEHLDEAIAELVATGMSPDDAAKKVIEDFGDPEMVREGLQSVYGHSVTSLLVDKAMEWKENSMKSEWRWNTAALLGSLLVTALAVSFVIFLTVWVVPWLKRLHSDLATPLPTYLAKTVYYYSQVVDTAWIWLIVLAAVVLLFEWRCKSNNKSLIRTAMAIAASLVCVAFALYFAVVIILPFADLHERALKYESKANTVAKIIEAHEAFEAMDRAAETNHWHAVTDYARQINHVYRGLSDRDTVPLILASENQQQNVPEIERLVAEIAELSDKVRSSYWDQRSRPSIPRKYKRLKASYSQLMEKSAFLTKHADIQRRIERFGDRRELDEAKTPDAKPPAPGPPPRPDEPKEQTEDAT